MPTEHSNVMGGSTAAQRINCPGSYMLEKNAPPKKASEFANEGSMLHAAMELLLTENVQTMEEAEPLFQQLIGQDMGYEGHEITEGHIEDKIRPAYASWLNIMRRYKLDDWFIEARVSLEAVVPGAFGTADVIAKDKRGMLHIIDWKFGDGVPVEAEGNYGLGFYAGCAMYDTDPEMEEFTSSITGVVLHIVQPRRGVADDPWKHWETDEEWIEALIDQAAEAMEKAIPLSPESDRERVDGLATKLRAAAKTTEQ